MKQIPLGAWLAAGLTLVVLSTPVLAMCGYFRPVIVDLKNPVEVLQPSQVAFITWDPVKKMETVAVQPRFEGNALDFGMVIPTPSKPSLHEMPRDFFKALEVFTAAKRRAFPQSRFLPRLVEIGPQAMALGAEKAGGEAGGPAELPRPSTVKVHEAGLVGSLDYKILSAGRPDDLYTWLKDNKYNFAGDETTLDFYVKKNYFFTVMKIDTLQMKKRPDGSFLGEITPTRFTFASDQLVYPLKITQVSVKDKTEALFYVQAPFKVDLQGDMSFQYQWVSMLDQVQNSMGPGELIPPNRKWLKEISNSKANIYSRGRELDFLFQFGMPSGPNKKGHLPASLEWAKRLTAADIKTITGENTYSELVPDPDDGFTAADLRNPHMAQAILKVIRQRMEKYQNERPRGYLVRDASREDLKLLPLLKGHLPEGQFLTKISKSFNRDEMNQDLVLIPARVGNVEDQSEHEEVLRMMIGRGLGRPFPPGFRPL